MIRSWLDAEKAVQELKDLITSVKAKVTAINITDFYNKREIDKLIGGNKPTDNLDSERQGGSIVHRLKHIFKGTVNLNGLTASRPLKLDANKDIISSKIDLSSANDVNNALGAANGGTGRNTLTSGSYLKGNGTGQVTLQATPIPVADGGTGQVSLTSGYALIGNGTGAVTLVGPTITGSITLTFSTQAIQYLDHTSTPQTSPAFVYGLSITVNAFTNGIRTT